MRCKDVLGRFSPAFSDKGPPRHLREGRECHGIPLQFVFKGHQTFGPQLDRLLRENEGKFLLKWGVGRLFDMRVVGPDYILKVAERVSK